METGRVRERERKIGSNGGRRGEGGEWGREREIPSSPIRILLDAQQEECTDIISEEEAVTTGIHLAIGHDDGLQAQHSKVDKRGMP